MGAATTAAEPDPGTSHAVSPQSSLDLRDLRAVAVLGRGAKGVVFLVRPAKQPLTEKGGGHRQLALKAISRRLLRSGSGGDHKEQPSPSPSPPPRRGSGSGSGSGSAYRRIRFEREVLAALHHPLLPALRGVVSTDEIVGFAIDRCSGGTLDALRKRQTEKMFSEEAIRFYAAELVLALEHLHGLGIVYRDLKPDNVLIQDNGHIMLVDFDLSTRLSVTSRPAATSVPSPPPSAPASPSPNSPSRLDRARRHRNSLKSWLSCGAAPRPSSDPSSAPQSSSSSSSSSSGSAAAASTSSSSAKSNSFVGTEEYVAPEVIRGTGHDFSVDFWGLGVVLYEMLYGRTPFRGHNRKETFYRVLSKDPDLSGEKTALRDLIGKLLDKDPEKRLTVQGIKEHEFFCGVDWGSVMSIARPPFIPVQVDEEGAVGESEEQGIDVEGFVRGLFFPDGNGNNDNGGSNYGKCSDQEQEAGGDHRRSKDVPAAAGKEGSGTVVVGCDNTWVHGLPKPSHDNQFSAF